MMVTYKTEMDALHLVRKRLAIDVIMEAVQKPPLVSIRVFLYLLLSII